MIVLIVAQIGFGVEMAHVAEVERNNNVFKASDTFTHMVFHFLKQNLESPTFMVGPPPLPARATSPS